jgi:hypothetical protein
MTVVELSERIYISLFYAQEMFVTTISYMLVYYQALALARYHLIDVMS